MRSFGRLDAVEDLRARLVHAPGPSQADCVGPESAAAAAVRLGESEEVVLPMACLNWTMEEWTAV